MTKHQIKAPGRALLFAPFLNLENSADRPLFVASVLAQFMPVDIITSDFDHTRKSKRETRIHPPFAQVTYLKARPYAHNVSVARLVSHVLFGLKAAAYFRRNRNRYDFVYATVPLNMLTWLVFSLAGVRTKILDVVDIWPDVLPFSSRSKMLLTPVFAAWKWFFKFAASKADLIMTVSDDFLKETAKYAKKAIKAERFYIGQDRMLCSGPKQPIFTIVYVGNLGRLYDFNTLVDVLSGDGLRECVQLFLVGTGDRQDWLICELERRKIRYHFFGPVFELGRLAEILCSCHVGFNGYINTTAAFSYKATTYFAACLPIINSMPGDLQRLVVEHGLGENYKGGNRQQLRDCLLRFYLNGTAIMAANCERFFKAELDSSEIAADMKNFFASNIFENRYASKARFSGRTVER